MKKLMITLLVAGALASCKNSKNMSSNSDAEPATEMYIDVHHLGAGNVTAEDVAKAHEKDLAVQAEFHVKFKKYWVDEVAGLVYCLSEAPSKESIKKTHEMAHGLIPEEVFQVSDGEEAIASGNFKYFLDIHELGKGNVTAEAVAGAHEKDLDVQGKYGVNFINYWVSEEEGLVYCLSEAKSEEDVIHTHEEAHGLIPDHIKEVHQGE